MRADDWQCSATSMLITKQVYEISSLMHTPAEMCGGARMGFCTHTKSNTSFRIWPKERVRELTILYNVLARMHVPRTLEIEPLCAR
jgi:hypothetical protein